MFDVIFAIFFDTLTRTHHFPHFNTHPKCVIYVLKTGPNPGLTLTELQKMGNMLRNFKYTNVAQRLHPQSCATFVIP